MRALIHLSTSSLEQHDRLAHWNRLISGPLGGCSVSHPPDAPFEAAFSHWSLGSLRLMRAQSGRSHVAVQADETQGSADGGRIKLHLQNRGFSETTQGARSTLLTPGDLSLCDLGESYSVDVSHRGELLMLEMPAESLGNRNWRSTLLGRRLPKSLPAVGRLRSFILSLWEETCQAGDDLFDEDTLERVLVDLVRMAIRVDPGQDQARDDDTCRRIMAWIDARLYDPHLCTATVAHQTGYGVRTLQEIFARQGSTPTRFILGQRLARAKALLASGDPGMSISDIAFGLGFNDSSYFGRRFRDAFGMSPREFRLRQRR